MHLTFRCPGCRETTAATIEPATASLHCPACGWDRPVAATPRDDAAAPAECLVCGCRDLWRQKDFPQSLGVGLVALAAVLSTVAWAWYQPGLALGILLAFALVDLLLYTFLSDRLVCYRCGARYRQTGPDAAVPPFNLETAERYRQEAHRLGQ